jgi:L-iditol 2-dehydrogenase
MKGLVLHAVDDLRYEEVPDPVPGAGEVRVRIAFCGVCGSDLPRCFEKGTYRFPTICGHEFAGTIESCGPGVADFAVGDRVAVFPLLWCGKCEACRTETYAQCRDYDYLGSRSDGGFAEFVVAPTRNLMKLSPSVSLEEAAMTEPAAVAHHALMQAGGCTSADDIALWGAGPIGLMAAMLARAQGARRVLLLDVDPTKLDLARRLGFHEVCDLRTNDAGEWFKTVLAGAAPTMTMDAAGVPASLKAALTHAAPGGKVVWLGNPSADVTLPMALISQCLRRELCMYGTWNSSYHTRDTDDDWHAVLRAVESGALRLRPLITHRVPLSEAANTLRAMRDRKFDFVKVLIHPDAPS